MGCFITDYKTDIPAGGESVVLEDSIMHKGRPVTAGAKMLENFISPLDATVVTRLEAAGVTIIGKSKMGEFGISGLFAEVPPENSGAVSAVADGLADFALCNDYTGAIGQQAAANGLYYIHPTYGTVSRYGLIPAVVSMDQIGIVCRNPADGFRLLSIFAGHDPNDGAMIMRDAHDHSVQCTVYSVQETGDADSGQCTVYSVQETGDAGGRKLTIGVPQNFFSGNPGEASSVGFIGVGSTGGLNTVNIELKYFDVYAQVMQILCCAEISCNISRYDGIKFGHRTDSFANLHELYSKSRTEGFGQDTKLAAIVGAMALSQENYSRYYDKAMRVRRLIKESLEFDKYDVILLSPLDKAAEWQLGLHALPRLCGLPAITAPFGSGWVSLVADVGCEDVLFSAIEEMGL